MKKIANWEDIDLTSFSIEPSADRAVFQISSCFDGNGLATVVCSGILVVRIQSALAPNGSELPVYIGELTVTRYTSDETANLLLDSGYGFTFDQKVLSRRFDEVVEVIMEGGEIEVCLIAIDCQITPASDSAYLPTVLG